MCVYCLMYSSSYISLGTLGNLVMDSIGPVHTNTEVFFRSKPSDNWVIGGPLTSLHMDLIL